MYPKKIYNSVPKTQHRPIGTSVYRALKAPKIPFKRKFNFKKAKWVDYTNELDTKIDYILPTPEHYDSFVELIKNVLQKHILR